jgi:FKBP-type peptidyl-prolyl cis-trans isomerase (trigger factor)
MTKINKLPNNEMEIESEISADVLQKHFDKILKDAINGAEISGFRKGKAPEKMVRDQIGDKKLLDEAAIDAISETYPEIIKENNLKPITSPVLTIVKLALGNPLEFKMKIAVLTEFSLPDYKMIASPINKKEIDKKELEVEEKEVDDVITQIRLANLTEEERKNNPPAGGEAPALTDEMAQKIGNFKTVTELREKIRENIGKEKEIRAKDKKRAEIIEEIIKQTQVVLPEVLVENELARMLAQFAGDIERMGLKTEDYLARLKKTEDDLKKEWRTDAEKRAKLQLILNKIADEEKLVPEEEKVTREIEHLSLHYKDADPERLRNYVETTLTNEKVFELLENQK